MKIEFLIDCPLSNITNPEVISYLKSCPEVGYCLFKISNLDELKGAFYQVKNADTIFALPQSQQEESDVMKFIYALHTYLDTRVSTLVFNVPLAITEFRRLDARNQQLVLPLADPRFAVYLVTFNQILFDVIAIVHHNQQQFKLFLPPSFSSHREEAEELFHQRWLSLNKN